MVVDQDGFGLAATKIPTASRFWIGLLEALTNAVNQCIGLWGTQLIIVEVGRFKKVILKVKRLKTV